VVKASLDSDGKFKEGDRVACAGQDYASHSEVVAVPQNLIAKIPDSVSFEEASFTTLGAIALQGVRQANPTLGENICVIGLGLLGQITCQLLKANGCNVFGIDLSQDLLKLAVENGADNAMLRSDGNLTAAIENFTNGYGFDSVIITAAAPSNDPIELSAEITKRKGKVIVVGAVKMDIPRDPHFYRKELELKLSCSYGPGRYDVNYEELGQDYPYGYVRWTEQRNMEAFLQLISKKAIDLKPLITHTFDISDAEKAYDIVLGKVKEKHLGILLSYPQDNAEVFQTKFELQSQSIAAVNVGFIGAGSFAQSYLIPNVKNNNSSLDTVVTSKGITAKNVGEKFGFKSASSNADDMFNNSDINTVFIATPHNSHATYTIKGIEEGKQVFVEKPIAMNYDELEQVKAAYSKGNSKVMVGFNRRFAPISKTIKERFKGSSEPLVMNMRVNAGFIPKDHWTQIDEIGGGRIVGEMCHFIDLMQYFCDAVPVSVYASRINSENTKINTFDNISVIVNFSNGSIGNLIYLGNGDKSLPKEQIEVFGANKVGIIYDFRGGMFHANNKAEKLKVIGKGHKQEVSAFIECLKNDTPTPISFESIYKTTLTTFKIIDSLNTGLPQVI
jgi:polar amino acid transport system substrate-binding protein